jgi:hypothetical protein
MKSAAQTALLTLLILAMSAPVALAGDNGQGWIGEATDKTITFFGLGIIVLFPLIALIGSYIQGRLQRRTDERKSAIFKHH